MRPRKYICSELAAPPIGSAQVFTLDAAIDKRYRPETAAELTGVKSERQYGSHGSSGLTTRMSRDQPRLTAHEMQGVVDGTDVAILLLDIDLTLRFFTPAAKRVFAVVPEDIGRHLMELSAFASEAAFVSDAVEVLQSLEPLEREIEARGGAWYVRRILPYCPQGRRIEGIVVTFVDVTRQKQACAALECAKAVAETANLAKSRFLSAASHDLRQPLQTLVLLQELLSKVVVDDKAKRLVDRFDETLGCMSGMLNGLLDVHRIEAGTVRPELQTFPLGALLDRVRSDLACQADAEQIGLYMLPCRFFVNSDPRLLEQMIRNLLSNAIKYTKRGRVLLGYRRRNGIVSIQIWDTGIGIPEDQLDAIFEEYHQLDHSPRNRSRGLGLGLAIVKRLGILLNHSVKVRSELGKGSVFSIEVEQSADGRLARDAEVLSYFQGEHRKAGRSEQAVTVADDLGVRDLPLSILAATQPSTVVHVVDDDGDVRGAIRGILEQDGHAVADYVDAESFLAAYRPGHEACVLIDANLPGLSGLNLLRRLRDTGHPLPAIMITGRSDVPTAVEAMKAGALDFLEKPIRGIELRTGVARALELSRDSGKLTEWRKIAADHLAGLTQRQHQILEMVLAGHPSKNIAIDLGISRRTVESHRASIMRKAGVRSLPALARLALAAAGGC